MFQNVDQPKALYTCTVYKSCMQIAGAKLKQLANCRQLTGKWRKDIQVSAIFSFCVIHTVTLSGVAYFLLLCTFAELRKATICYVMSVRSSAWTNCATAGRVFMKFDIRVFFFRNCRENSNLIKIGNRTTGTLHEDRYTFFIISRSILHRMKRISEKKVVEKLKPHILCSIVFSQSRVILR